jgi:energy-coupling factor transporter ATP-binding protein EcfA2
MAIGNDSKISYQTGVQAGPATNAGALSGLLTPQKTGDQRANQFAGMTAKNDRAQLGLASQNANAQFFADAQAKRSEAALSGANDQATIHENMNQRVAQKLDLDAGVQASNIGFQSGITAANIRRWMNVARGNA